MKYHISLDPVLRVETLNTCSLFRASHPYDFHREFHPFWEIVYVTEGTLRIACQEKVYTMNPGDLIIHRPMELHRLWSLENRSFQVLVVGFCARGSLLSQLKDTAFMLTQKQQDSMNALIQKLQQYFPNAQPQFLRYAAQNPEEYASQLQMFVNTLENFLISLLYKRDYPESKPQSFSESDRLYSRIVEELNGSPDGWITARQIAERLHCSESQIKQTFSKYSNMGIHKYLINLKIAAAMQMLQQGCTISETSRRLGFSNQNYFSTVFKRETGKSPSSYIREITGL